MANKDKANEIIKDIPQHPYHITYEEVIENFTTDQLEECLLDMAEWKDKQINLLLDAIDHAYLQLDGSYGDLALEVADKVKYLKLLRQ